MFWRCILGLCPRMKCPFSLDADILDYRWRNLFSESMTLLLWHTEPIKIIRTCVFGTWISSQSIEMVLMHRSKKNLLKNQPDINFLHGRAPVFIWWTSSICINWLAWTAVPVSSVCQKKIQKQSLVLNDGDNIPWRFLFYISYYWNWWQCINLYSTMMAWPLGVAVKMKEILTSSLPEICWSAKGKN